MSRPRTRRRAFVDVTADGLHPSEGELTHALTRPQPSALSHDRRSMNMQRLGALVVVVVAVLAIAGCSFPSLSRAPAVRFHGEATDPIGDTASVADVRVARPADLVYASVQVTNDALRLTVRFAPGSLDPATTGATFLLDTDLDPKTGARNLGLGAEYLVSLHAGPVREATVARAVTDANCATPRARVATSRSSAPTSRSRTTRWKRSSRDRRSPGSTDDSIFE